jgi:undecaprenyl-diphosphatase
LAALTACAVALSWLAHKRDRLPGDLWLARRIQELPGAFELPAELLRAATTTWVVVLVGTALVTAFDFLGRRRAWLVFAVMLLLLPPVQASIKNLVDRPRPDPSLIERRATFTSESFPSGHVLGGTVLFLLAAWLVAGRVPAGWPRAAIWSTAGAACALGGIANVYEGVHWPSDVLGGYLWAGVLLVGAWLVVRKVQRRA